MTTDYRKTKIIPGPFRIVGLIDILKQRIADLERQLKIEEQIRNCIHEASIYRFSSCIDLDQQTHVRIAEIYRDLSLEQRRLDELRDLQSKGWT